MDEFGESDKQNEVPQLNLPEIFKDVNTYEAMRDAVITELKRLTEENGVKRIGFVSGPLGTTHRSDNWKKSIEEMLGVTNKLHDKIKIPVFSAATLFQGKLFNRVEANRPEGMTTSQANQKMFDAILRAGYVTDIYAAGLESGSRLLSRTQGGLKI